MSAALKEEIRRQCAELDIPLVGFAPVDRWDEPRFDPWVPEAFRPRAIWPEANTVIVIGLPVTLPIIETAPSIWYHELYKTVNALLDQHGYRIATRLTGEGHPSVWVPRDGYGSIGVLKERPVAFFSHRHAAFLAGLGTFGINNTILTTEFGPRVRFAAIFTAAEIAPDPVMEGDLCTRCMRCVDACPVSALDGERYPAGLTNKRACADQSEDLSSRYISPCGICIKVCPVGKDRIRFNRNDPDIYHETGEDPSKYQRAWDHVRAYGGR